MQITERKMQAVYCNVFICVTYCLLFGLATVALDFGLAPLHLSLLINLQAAFPFLCTNRGLTQI